MTSETTPGLRCAVRLVALGFHTKGALACFSISPPSVPPYTVYGLQPQVCSPAHMFDMMA